jgi:hypothetical protein
MVVVLQVLRFVEYNKLLSIHVSAIKLYTYVMSLSDLSSIVQWQNKPGYVLHGGL